MTGQAMYVCHKCGMVLSSKQAFTYHMNRKRPCVEKFDCVCGSVFKTKFDRYIHQLNCDHFNSSKTETSSCHDLAKNTHVRLVLNSSGTCIDALVGGTSVPFDVISSK